MFEARYLTVKEYKGGIDNTLDPEIPAGICRSFNEMPAFNPMCFIWLLTEESYNKMSLINRYKMLE